MFKNKKNSKSNITGMHSYFNYITVEELSDDIIINFQQVDNKGIVSQYRVIMSIISAKLTNGIIEDVLEEFEEIEYKINEFPIENFSNKDKLVNEIDNSLHYVNHLYISSNPISIILEYVFEGPDGDECVNNIILKPELAKYLFWETHQYIKKYEEIHGEINLEDFLS